MEDSTYWLVIVLTTVGFFGLAALLLVPVYRFLMREEEASKQWTGPRRDRKDEEGSEDGRDADAPSLN